MQARRRAHRTSTRASEPPRTQSGSRKVGFTSPVPLVTFRTISRAVGTRPCGVGTDVVGFLRDVTKRSVRVWPRSPIHRPRGVSWIMFTIKIAITKPSANGRICPWNRLRTIRAREIRTHPYALARAPSTSDVNIHQIRRLRPGCVAARPAGDPSTPHRPVLWCAPRAHVVERSTTPAGGPLPVRSLSLMYACSGEESSVPAPVVTNAPTRRAAVTTRRVRRLPRYRPKVTHRRLLGIRIGRLQEGRHPRQDEKDSPWSSTAAQRSLRKAS